MSKRAIQISSLSSASTSATRITEIISSPYHKERNLSQCGQLIKHS